MTRLQKRIVNLPGVSSQFIVFLCIVLLILCGMYYVLSRPTPYNSAEQERVLRADKQNYEASLLKSNKYRGEQNYKEAVRVLEKYADTAVGKQNKVFTYVRIANIYEVQRDNKKALEVYRQAEVLQDNQENVVAIGIARTSYALGDKVTALKYYKVCLGMLEKANKPSDERDIIRLKRIIATVEASK